jgi:hypothetical protein
MSNWGKSPVLFSQVRGTVTVTVNNASNLKIYAMDAEGNAVREVKHTTSGNAITFKTDYFVPWYLFTA